MAKIGKRIDTREKEHRYRVSLWGGEVTYVHARSKEEAINNFCKRKRYSGGYFQREDIRKIVRERAYKG